MSAVAMMSTPVPQTSGRRISPDVNGRGDGQIPQCPDAVKDPVFGDVASGFAGDYRQTPAGYPYCGSDNPGGIGHFLPGVVFAPLAGIPRDGEYLSVFCGHFHCAAQRAADAGSCSLILCYPSSMVTVM